MLRRTIGPQAFETDYNAWSGGALWVSTFLVLGYYLGDNWKQIAELVHRDVGYASLVLIAAVLLFVLIRRTIRRKKLPEA